MRRAKPFWAFIAVQDYIDELEERLAKAQDALDYIANGVDNPRAVAHDALKESGKVAE